MSGKEERRKCESNRGAGCMRERGFIGNQMWMRKSNVKANEEAMGMGKRWRKQMAPGIVDALWSRGDDDRGPRGPRVRIGCSSSADHAHHSTATNHLCEASLWRMRRDERYGIDLNIACLD